MMNAQDIKEVLDKIDFNWKYFFNEIGDYAIEVTFENIDADVIAAKLLDAAEKKGLLDKLKPWMIAIIGSLGPDTAQTILMGVIKTQVNEYLEDHNLTEMINEAIDDWLNDDEPEEPPVDPDPIPQPLQKMRKFVPVGEPKLLWQGHDNAPVTQALDGTLYTATGDGFVGGTKYETCLFKLPNGKDPMNPGHWQFMQGTRGKCYGLVCIGNTLYLLQSDKGSGWEGMQNCRRWDVFSNKRSSRTFQQELAGDGANWFVIQKGLGHRHGYQPEYIVDVGCVTFAGHGHGQHHANFKTPIRLWRGDIRDLTSFQYIGIAQGINGPRNNWTTTMSITYIPERKQYVSGGGDWTASQIYQSVSQNDAVGGPYTRKDIDTFSPPMTRDSYKDGTRWSGVFTSSYFSVRGQWYQMLSGHNPSGKENNDDSVWCRKVNAVV